MATSWPEMSVDTSTSTQNTGRGRRTRTRRGRRTRTRRGRRKRMRTRRGRRTRMRRGRRRMTKNLISSGRANRDPLGETPETL